MTMTQREVFDKVKNHLLEQETPALDDYGNCMYRAHDDKMCAVGCLIKDEYYSVDLEGLGVSPYGDPDLDSKHKVWKALRASGIALDDKMINMLVDLQYVHDGTGDTTGGWPAGLDRVERKYFGEG